MNPSRRDCLKIGLLAGAGAGLSGCGIVARQVESRRRDNLLTRHVNTDEARILNRVGFGADAESLAAMRKVDREQYITDQLAASADEPLKLILQLNRLDVLQLETSDLRDLPSEAVIGQLQQAAILYSVYSANQLRERMVDFWTNHFNIYARKGNVAYAKGPEEVRIIRKHALGSFPEMLKSIAHSPAMLEYLDNQKNQKGVANENYARELMELHTLGIHGGYFQRDVQEVARCFTGWRIEDRFLHARGHFRFDPDRHDDGEKIVLGHRIAGGGEEDGNKVLALLANHPSTARFLATKLSQYFLGAISNHWVESLAARYQSSEGDIAFMLGPLLRSPDLVSSPPILKRPFDYAISAIRSAGGETDGGAPLRKHLEKMGEALYEWPMPDGYPTKTSSWTSSLLPRWNFAFAFANGNIEGSNSGNNYVPKDKLALALCAPEFQWR